MGFQQAGTLEEEEACCFQKGPALTRAPTGPAS